MNIVLNYTLHILRRHRYLFISVPLVAAVSFIAFFNFAEANTVVDWKNVLAATDLHEKYRSAIFLANRGPFHSGDFLVLFIPFVHLAFLRRTFYNPMELTLPLSTLHRFLSYLLIAIVIFILNAAVIALFNYLIEIYLQYTLSDVTRTGYHEFGFLYHDIPESSIFYNAAVNRSLLTFAGYFLIILPIYLLGTFYFSKQSQLKSAIILVVLLVGVGYLSNWIWDGNRFFINNKSYIQAFPFLWYGLASIMLYISFFNLLKRKEL